MSMPTLAVASQKGGTGKTTTALHLARIGEAGRKGAGLDESRDATARYFASGYGDYLTQIEGALR